MWEGPHGSRSEGGKLFRGKGGNDEVKISELLRGAN